MNRRQYFGNMKILLTEWHLVADDVKHILGALWMLIRLIVGISIRLVLIAFLPIAALLPLVDKEADADAQRERMKNNRWKNGPG